MHLLSEHFQSADWKKEKHIPVIELPAKIKKGEFFEIKISIGKEIPHPNTTDHHIRWIEVYFLGEGLKFPAQIGKIYFDAHGESVDGPDTSTIYTHPYSVMQFKTDKPGMLYASSYCNIHGLWQNSMELKFSA